MLRGSVTTWQIWNEANHQEYTQPKPNLDVYTAMLKSSYSGIKALDPTATVIAGGFAPAPDAADGTEYQPATFLKGMYARGAKGYFDAIGHHPYAYPFNPLEPQSWNAYTQTIGLHTIMARARRRREEDLGHRGRRADGDRHEGALGVEAGAVGARLLPRLEHGVPLVHRSARVALGARRGHEPYDQGDNMGLLRHDWSHKLALHHVPAADARRRLSRGCVSRRRPGRARAGGPARAGLAEAGADLGEGPARVDGVVDEQHRPAGTASVDRERAGDVARAAARCSPSRAAARCRATFVTHVAEREPEPGRDPCRERRRPAPGRGATART